MDLRWGLKFCIYNKFLGEVDIAHLWTNIGSKDTGGPVHSLGNLAIKPSCFGNQSEAQFGTSMLLSSMLSPTGTAEFKEREATDHTLGTFPESAHILLQILKTGVAVA